MSQEGLLTNAVIFLASVGGGYWLISKAGKKEMLADSDVFPSDAEKMMYQETGAKTIIPYSLYEGAQGSLYRDFVFDDQTHLPTDAPLYSRPALTTLNYDRAFGSGPSRILNLPYRVHEGTPVTLLGLMVPGSYAMPEEGVPAGEFSAEPVAFTESQEVPNGLETLTQLDTSALYTDSWPEIGFNNNMPTYPLVMPRTDSVVSTVIGDIGRVTIPKGQYLSYGRDATVLYDPFTMMNETPDTNAAYTDGTHTQSRHEWEQDYDIFGLGDQQLAVDSHSGFDSLRLRRR
jgi:hypothetical protein